MQTQAKSKKLGAVLASIVIAMAMMVAGIAMASDNAAKAAQDQSASNAVNVISITTGENADGIAGMPDGPIKGDVTPSQSPKSTTDLNEEFKVLVNPAAADMTSPPSKQGIIVACDLDGTGDPDKQVIISLKTENDGDDYQLMKLVTPEGLEHYDGDEINYSYEPIEGKTVPADDLKYDKQTGVLTFASEYQKYDTITIYNYLSSNQRKINRDVYGTLELDGVANIKLRNDTNPDDPKQHPVVKYKLPNSDEEVTGYWIGSTNGGYFNAILNQMPGVIGSQQIPTGYTLKSCKIYSIVLNSDNQVVSSFPLRNGTHYTMKGDRTIEFDSGLSANKILIMSNVVTKENYVPTPTVQEKTDNSLSFLAAPNYTYKLYHEVTLPAEPADPDNPEAPAPAPKKEIRLLATKTQADVSRGLVTFGNLSPNTTYWIEYVDASGNALPRKKVKTPEKFVPYDYSFKKGDTFTCNVSVGGHWDGWLSIDGGSFSQGRTIFGCTVNSVSGNDQLHEMFRTKKFNASCITPGAGYSSGNSKNAVMEILEANTQTGYVKALIYMRGAWVVGGRSIQNIAGNIDHQDSKIKIAVQKESADLEITNYNNVANHHYSLEGIEFDIHVESYDGEVVDTLTTDADGFDTSEELAPGTYYVTEADTPENSGYGKVEIIDPVVGTSGDTVKFTVADPPETGTVKVHKDSTDPRSENNPYYNFEGIEYTLTGDEYGHMYKITLNKNGDGSVDNIAYDTYTMVETKTNKWYQLSEEVQSVPVLASTTDRGTTPITVNTKDEPEYVWLELDKQTADPSITEHNTGVYSLLHAKYEIVCKTPLNSGNTADPSMWLPAVSQGAEDNIIETGVNKEDGTVVTDPHNGYGKSAKLLYGDYEVHEILDSQSFALDPVIYGINHEKFHPQADNLSLVPESQRTYHIVQEDKISGTSTTSGKGDLEDNADVDFSFVLNKKDDLNHENTGGGDTNLSAVFEIRYYAVANPSETSTYDSSKPMDVWYVETDENGQAKFDDILERNADGSIKMNGAYGIGKTYEGKRSEQGMPRDYKYTQNPANDGRIYIKRDSNGEAHAVIPVGIVEIEEVVAPEGYRYESGSYWGRDSLLFDPEKDAKPVVHKIYNRELKSNDSDWANGRFDTKQAEVSVSFPGGVVEDHIYRGDVVLQKMRADDSTSLNAPIPFLVTSATTGEQHVIVTNNDGFYTSESLREALDNKRVGYPHKFDTNYNDAIVDTNGDGVFSEEELANIDADKLRFDVGTFFYGYGPNKAAENAAKTEIKESDGAFPHDSYVAQELRVPANEGLALLKFDFTIANDHFIFQKDVNDFPVRIHTTATDKNTGTHQGDPSGETVTIVDEVRYEGLTRDQTYTMTGTLMNKKTGEPLTDAAGNKFVVSKEFTTTDTEGSVSLTFTVPSEVIRGTATVVFESCVFDGVEIGIHADIDDEGQTVVYPEVHTTATDSVTEDHYGQIMNETITVVDKVQCNGLMTGKEYTISGKLMDKATGKELVGPNGETYSAEAKFTADSPDPVVELRFDVPRSVIAGKTVVAFEYLYNNGVQIGSHADLEDEDQTVYYPNVHTTATDNTTGMHVGVANDTTVINDKVEYENLINGAKYVVEGTLMDKDTGEAITDDSGNQITASAEFVAGEGSDSKDKYVSGEVMVTFNAPKDAIAGHSTVVFEELQYVVGTAPDSDKDEDGSKIPVADHKDLNDEGQTVYYPEIHTLAFAGDIDLNQVLPALHQVEGFWDQIEGDANVANKLREFRIIGINDTTFEPTDLLALIDKDANATRDFNADPVTYDEIMALVNAPQCTYNPIMSVDNTRAQIDMATNMVTFKDTIEYKNLLVGEKYIAEGVLMDKATGTAIIDGNTGNEIHATTEFSPITRDGFVEVTFTFDASNIGLDFTRIQAGEEEAKDVVVFEELFLKGGEVADELIKVAEHKDINDMNQSIPIGNFPAAELADDLVSTGDAGIAIISILIAANAVAFGYAYRKRRKAGIV